MVVAVSRNISDLLFFHVQLAARMVEVLKEEALSYVPKSEDSLVEFEKVERVVRRLAALFVEDVSLDVCSTLIRRSRASRRTTASAQDLLPLWTFSGRFRSAQNGSSLKGGARSSRCRPRPCLSRRC